MELGAGRQVDEAVVRHLRDELPVDVERVLGAVPGGRDLVPFALPPVSDRRADAIRDTTVVRELKISWATVALR